MRLKRLLSISFSFILLSSMPALANGLQIEGVGRSYSSVSMAETDRISGNGLIVDWAISLGIGLSMPDNTITVLISPWFFGKSSQPQNININVCEGYATGIDIDLAHPNINCSRIANYTYEEIMGVYGRVDYNITINLTNLTDVNNYVIKMEYFVPNFVFKEGKNYIASFSSFCNPQDRCGTWDRFITLPYSSSVIVDLSGVMKILNKINEKWVLSMSSEDQSFVRYYDSFETDILEPLKWSLFGALIGILPSLLLVFVVGRLKKPKLKFGKIDPLIVNKTKFFRLFVKNEPYGKRLKRWLSLETATNCVSKIEILDKRTKKILKTVERSKWASKGEPFGIDIDNGQAILTVSPTLFDETRFENIPTISERLLDVIGKRDGEEWCFIITPENYYSKNIPESNKIGKGNFIIRITVIDDGGSLVKKNFILKNSGKTLNDFTFYEIPTNNFNWEDALKPAKVILFNFIVFLLPFFTILANSFILSSYIIWNIKYILVIVLLLLTSIFLIRFLRKFKIEEQKLVKASLLYIMSALFGSFNQDFTKLGGLFVIPFLAAYFVSIAELYSSVVSQAAP